MDFKNYIFVYIFHFLMIFINKLNNFLKDELKLWKCSISNQSTRIMMVSFCRHQNYIFLFIDRYLFYYMLIIFPLYYLWHLNNNFVLFSNKHVSYYISSFEIFVQCEKSIWKKMNTFTTSVFNNFSTIFISSK